MAPTQGLKVKEEATSTGSLNCSLYRGLHRDRKTDYQGQSNREGKAIAKERRAKQKGKTEGTAIQATNGKAIELGNPPERLHSQSLKHERDGIDRLKKGVKG
ncbi:hypothetical protein Tco_1126732 [Tanacetum coccineum]